MISYMELINLIYEETSTRISKAETLVEVIAAVRDISKILIERLPEASVKNYVIESAVDEIVRKILVLSKEPSDVLVQYAIENGQAKGIALNPRLSDRQISMVGEWIRP